MPSIVWTFFEKGKDEVKCKKCGHRHVFKPGASTSNMLRHLQTNHPIEYASEAEKIKRPGKRNLLVDQKKHTDFDSVQVLTATTSASTSALSPSLPDKIQKLDQSDTTIHPQVRMKQETLQASLTKTVPYKQSSPKKKKLDELVLDLITKDILPLSIVENQAFRRLIHELDPRYEIVSRKQLTKKLLPEKYREEKEMLKNELSKVESVSVTTDQWTSRAHEGYTTITAHFIDSNWEVKSPVLLTRAKPQRHTAVNLAKELEEAFDEFSISDKITAVVTDNAANIKCAVSRLGNIEDGQSCFAHTLNLCVKHGIKEHPPTQEAVKKVKNIVTFFNHSTQAVNDLKKEHQLKGSSFYKLKKDVETRWNSTYLMLESFIKQRIEISTVLVMNGKSTAAINEEDVKIIEDAVTVLKPFLDVTREMSSEKYTSISKVIPIITILTKFLASHSSPLGAKLKDKIDYYFKDVETERFSMLSTFLDPRFKDKSLSKEVKMKVNQEVLNYLERTTELSLSHDEEMEEVKNPAQEKPEEASFWDEFDKEREEEKSFIKDKSAIEVELSRYTESQRCERKTDPLAWWKQNERNYPSVARMAKKYLSIPATSVPSERLFSKAGEIVSSRRASIKSKNVDMILFLNKVSNN